MDHPHSEQIGAVPGASRESVVKDESNSAPIRLLNAGKQSVGSSPRKSSTRDDRVRPTTYNPLYGSVEGVKCGNTDWSMHKNYHQYMQLTHLNIRCSSHETTSPCRDRLKESHIVLLTWNGGYCHLCKFTYIYLQRLAPCIPKETNGWLFFAAQHPNTTGQFVHYASSRLRRKAKDDTKELVKQFQVTINTLMNARHKDALKMGRVLENSRQELASKEEEVRRQGDQIREKDALLAKYKDMLGIEK